MATIRCSAPTWGIRTGASPLLSSHPSAANQACLPKQINTKIISKRLFLHNYARNGSNLVMSAMSNPRPQPTSLSPSETIEQFYICINDKDLTKLHKFISSDCWFDDYSFPSPFEGQKEVMHYLEQLLECSGKHVKFNVGSICERATKGGKFTVGVTWHLEWKEKPIPLTRGCSFYELSKQGEGLLIKEAQAVIESPIKPGTLALTLLKMDFYRRP